MLTVVLAGAAATAQAAYSFDAGERIADAADWPAFAAMLERHGTEAESLAACRQDADACPGHLRRARVILERGAALDRERQLRLVNRFVNHRRYREDRRRTTEGAAGAARLPSHWKTLDEFLYRGGDCEDFATAKYFMLREFGIPADDMRIVVARDWTLNEHHAVLVVRRPGAGDSAEDGAWLLDSDNRMTTRKPAVYRYEYAVNERGVWEHNPERRR